MTVSNPNDCIRKYTVPGEQTKSGSPKEKHFCGNCGCTLWTVVAPYAKDARVVRTSLIDGGLVCHGPH
jgi:hypothetical protein